MFEYNYSINLSQDYNIEQFTSTGCFKKVECTRKLPVFDDFIPVKPIKATYRGHRNTRTLIKETTFWGNDFIMSTSDCGHVFVWNRYTCEIVMLLVANTYAVNCIRPHPSGLLLVTSGLDGVIRLFSPTRDETLFDEEFAAAVKLIILSLNKKYSYYSKKWLRSLSPDMFQQTTPGAYALSLIDGMAFSPSPPRQSQMDERLHSLSPDMFQQTTPGAYALSLILGMAFSPSPPRQSHMDERLHSLSPISPSMINIYEHDSIDELTMALKKNV